MCLSFNDHEDFHLRRGAVVLLLLVRLTALKAFSTALMASGRFPCIRKMRLINLSDMAPVTPT